MITYVLHFVRCHTNTAKKFWFFLRLFPVRNKVLSRLNFDHLVFIVLSILGLANEALLKKLPCVFQSYEHFLSWKYDSSPYISHQALKVQDIFLTFQLSPFVLSHNESDNLRTSSVHKEALLLP